MNDFARNVAVGVVTLLIVQWVTRPVVVIKSPSGSGKRVRPEPLRAVVTVKPSSKPS